MSTLTQEILETTARAMMKASGGVMQVHLVQPADVVALMLAEAAGNADARALLKAVAGILVDVGNAKPPKMCACCPTDLTPDNVLAFVFVANGLHGQAIGMALCDACALHPDIDARVMDALRGLWPDLRPIEITHPEGGTA